MVLFSFICSEARRPVSAVSYPVHMWTDKRNTFTYKVMKISHGLLGGSKLLGLVCYYIAFIVDGGVICF